MHDDSLFFVKDNKEVYFHNVVDVCSSYYNNNMMECGETMQGKK